MFCRPSWMTLDGFRARVPNLSDALFSGASAGMRLNARLSRKSRFFRRLDYDFLILAATNISTCSRLFSKSLGGLPVGWMMFGFAILLAHGESRRIPQLHGGSSSLV